MRLSPFFNPSTLMPYRVVVFPSADALVTVAIFSCVVSCVSRRVVPTASREPCAA